MKYSLFFGLFCICTCYPYTLHDCYSNHSAYSSCSSIQLQCIEQVIEDLELRVAKGEINIAELEASLDKINKILKDCITQDMVENLLKRIFKKLYSAGWIQKVINDPKIVHESFQYSSLLQDGDHNTWVGRKGGIWGYNTFGKLFHITPHGHRIDY